MHNQREAGNKQEQREAARPVRVISFARDLDTIQIHLIVKALFYFRERLFREQNGEERSII